MKEQQRPNSITVLIESITKYLNPIDSWQPKIILDLADAKPVKNQQLIIMQVKSESSTANQNQGATLRCEHWNEC